MDDYILEVSSDSEKTILLPLEGCSSKLVDDIVEKYKDSSDQENFDKTHKDSKNKYDLSDFSDDDVVTEPLLKRIKSKSGSFEKVSSWQDNFSIGDFCENSNDVYELLQQSESSNKNKEKSSAGDDLKSLQNKYSFHNPSSTGSQDTAVESPEDLLTKLSDKYRLSNKEKIYENLALKSSNSLKNLKLSSGTNSTQTLATCSSSHEPESGCSGNFSSFNQNNEFQQNSEADIDATSTKKRVKNNSNKEQKQLEKELAKEAKKMEREQKKIIAEKEKARKNALKATQNSFKPEECLKNIIVNLNETISSMEYGQTLVNSLKNSSYSYRHISHDHSEAITWTRKVQTLDDMILQNKDENENFILKIMQLPDFLNHIQNSTLVAHFLSLKSNAKKLILAVVGLDQYCKYVEYNKKNKKKDGYDFKNLPKVSRSDIESSISELQILTKCYFKSVPNFEELSVFVLECTKSVAQIPYKNMKQKKYEEENEYFSGDNKDCVNVDRQGNGLNRLWKQMLTQFPLARLETSEAITSVYPTMASLFEAYENCSSIEEGERLLQNIPIRRAAGPLASVRKIGPELSKKVYHFFASKENAFL